MFVDSSTLHSPFHSLSQPLLQGCGWSCRGSWATQTPPPCPGCCTGPTTAPRSPPIRGEKCGHKTGSQPIRDLHRSGYSQQQQAAHPVYPVPAQDRVSLDPVDTLVNVSCICPDTLYYRCQHSPCFQSVENELSFEKFWNFFADPDTATRNLWLNIGFVSSLHPDNPVLYCAPVSVDGGRLRART